MSFPQVRGTKLINVNSMFHDRIHAGEVLAELIEPYVKEPNHFFIIPNGGVPVALPIIKKMVNSNLVPYYDLIPVKKIYIPFQSAGFGAITLDNEVLLNAPLVQRMNIHPKDIERLAETTIQEIERRKLSYKITKKGFDLRNKAAIIIDDGLPSGITMMAAIKSLRQFKPFKIIIAIPTASQLAIDNISPFVNEILCPNIRNTSFFSTAHCYDNYPKLNIDETKNYLEKFPILQHS